MSTKTGSSASRQVTFFTTGSVAGLASASASFAFDELSCLYRNTGSKGYKAFTTSLPQHLVKPGIRFWAFDIARESLPSSLPVSLKGGLAGASGGFIEMLYTHAQNALTSRGNARTPNLGMVVNSTLLHSSKLFLCFGSYTYLANTLSDSLPPKPFAYCLLLGAAAGAFGTAVITPFELYAAKPAHTTLALSRTLYTALGRAPRGAVGVGTVIAVQVTSADWLLKRISNFTAT